MGTSLSFEGDNLSCWLEQCLLICQNLVRTSPHALICSVGPAWIRPVCPWPLQRQHTGGIAARNGQPPRLVILAVANEPMHNEALSRRAEKASMDQMNVLWLAQCYCPTIITGLGWWGQAEAGWGWLASLRLPRQCSSLECAKNGP